MDYKYIYIFLLLFLMSILVTLFKEQILLCLHYGISLKYSKLTIGLLILTLQITYKLKFKELKIDMDNFEKYRISVDNIFSLIQNPATVVCAVSLFDKWLSDSFLPQNKRFFSEIDFTFLPYVAGYLLVTGGIDIVNTIKKCFVKIEDVTTVT